MAPKADSTKQSQKKQLYISGTKQQIDESSRSIEKYSLAGVVEPRKKFTMDHKGFYTWANHLYKLCSGWRTPVNHHPTSLPSFKR